MTTLSIAAACSLWSKDKSELKPYANQKGFIELTAELIQKFSPLQANRKELDSPLVCSVYFPKGGVGKTTISFNMARYFALQGIRVLLIGLDTQRNLSRYFFDQEQLASYQGDGLYRLHTLLKKNKDFSECIYATDLPFLSIVPEDNELSHLKSELDTEGSFIQNDLIPALKGKFDLIIFDCPPALPSESNRTKQAIEASSFILSPVSCDNNTLDIWCNTFPTLKKFIATVNPKCKIKVMLNNIQNWAYARESMAIVTEEEDIIGEPILSRSEVNMANYNHLSLFELFPKSENTQKLATIFNKIWSTLHEQQKIIA